VVDELGEQGLQTSAQTDFAKQGDRQGGGQQADGRDDKMCHVDSFGLGDVK
jgi:hypothetical protein